MASVLVTRPEPGATRTAERLAGMGLVPLVLPLSKVVALQHDVPDGPFDAVAITSASAARTISPALARKLSDLACFAVGGRTADAARRAGFRDVRPGPGDATRLVDLLAANLPRGARIAYPCGRLRMPALEAGLAAAGFRFVAVETYDVAGIEPTEAEMLAVIGGEAADYALAYSREGARRLARLAASPLLVASFERTMFLCLSEQVAEPLAGRHVLVASRPDETELLALIGTQEANVAF